MSESVNFDIKTENDLAIFKLEESRFDSQIAGLVKAEFTILLSDEITKLVIDMSEVEYCDSSGLSSLLLAFRILQSQEGHIRIAAPQKGIRTLIQISQLDRILPIFDTVEEAVKDLETI
ncbi:MAG: STAS domain-containing protein [Bacteroidota bacterium]